MFNKKANTAASIALLAAALAGCAAQAPVASKEATPNNDDWYLVRTESTLYVFDDATVYRDYLVTGKTEHTKAVGEKDKFGQDIVLVVRAEDQGKDVKKIAGYQFLKQSLPPAAGFYGEIRQEGVIYVAQRYGDMVDMNGLGEPIFRHTEIASGPNGERVVYLMQKEEKKPVGLIARFQKIYGITPAKG
ncbi:hypothetical protein N5J43_12755 [Pseudomonas nicosulfuronedens]|uniref:Uncharacterized protein n=1 Tax=Pseudomonas nicosulfuronedens TaxID=2571105 RepID=A0A5R9RAI5_9PSED|nr:hypothetical protein [Pseudomonas nicosulfuronedens]MDH1011480.1 hypothetical protein [Pseudomonas nicosulfuronedens]MDH1979820.1 hypothetical protein [Pseudomonas nicosulfuronedens]MDH2028255.1 hypothetical protein [Pseudomonas nicosulfuronedens]TLX80137.1 hypothetical protein FAS41_04390 [Pseudomonas nicosulfuronedens]